MFVKFLTINTFISIIYFFSIAIVSAEDNSLVIEIDNPKFSEKGLNDKTYEIKAKKGLKSDLELELFTVEGKFKSDSEGRCIYLEADKGNYNQLTNFIELERNIKFYTNDGEIIESNYATFDMINDVVILKDDIIHGVSEGLISADNSTISNNFNNFEYEGSVSTTLIVKD